MRASCTTFEFVSSIRMSFLSYSLSNLVIKVLCLLPNQQLSTSTDEKVSVGELKAVILKWCQDVTEG